MSRTLLSLALVLSVASVVSAQLQTIYFSTRFTETPASRRAGNLSSQTAQCNPVNLSQLGTSFAVESATMNSPGIGYVEPGVVNATLVAPNLPTGITDFVEVVNFPQMNIYIGDLDGDNVTDEADNFRGVDALYIPNAAVGRRNTIHDMFVSTFQDSVGAQGYIGNTITEADMVMFPAANNVYPAPSTPQQPIYFIRQAHFETFFGLTAPNNNIDVDAFAVDQTNGDIYVSFDGGSSSPIPNAMVRLNSAAVATPYSIMRGDIIRIPGTAYTPSGIFGLVTAPIAGFAELVMSGNDVQTMCLATGPTSAISITPINVYGLDLEPLGGTYANPTTGFTMPNLLFNIDATRDPVANMANPLATCIMSTLAGGGFASINGVTMNNPLSLGISTFNFDLNLYAGPLDALDVIAHTPILDPINDRPLHLDAFPTNRLLSVAGNYNGVITAYISGAAPMGQLAILGSLSLPGPGGYIDRWSVAPFLPGYPDLYIDVFGFVNPWCILAPAGPPFSAFCQNAGVQSLLSGGNNPVATWVDPLNGAANGDTCFELNLAPVLPALSPAFSPPPLIVFQALDLTTARLSDPISFQFN